MSSITLKVEYEAAGKFARTRQKYGTSEQKLNTSQLMAVTRTPIAVTTEVSPIIEVLNMADYTHYTTSIVPVTEPIFQASPSSITIREFRPQTTLQVEILLRNNDNVARRVKILQPESTFFKVVLNGKPGSKVAPGMCASYTLSFTPEEQFSDYFCDLVCCSEREKFVIPVKALGPRGWIDLPDEIEFETSPVKASTTKTILVRNMGEAECVFKIESLAPYFSVDPPTGTLAVRESMQLNFTFLPENMLPQDGEFRVTYSSGELIYVKTRGTGSELAVRLDSRALLMDATYVSLFSQKTFRIINRSEHTVSFCFKQFASAVDEKNAWQRFRGGLEVAGGQPTTEVEFDYSFKNDSFSISPAQGDVWPNAETEITVTFTPSTSTEMSCVAFCDIVGKEHRLPLQLQGTGIGPRIVLSYNVIDIGEVFINSVSEYDVELVNQGDISAAYELAQSYTVFGSKFRFEPSVGTLMVGHREHVKISFSSDVLGEFEEGFEWALVGTPQPLILTIRGKVIGPTFHIDQQVLDFKRVSVAFLCSRFFSIFNTSDIPFRFHLRVPGDGALLKREFEVATPAQHTSACVAFSIQKSPSTRVFVFKFRVHLAFDSDVWFLQLIPSTGTIVPHGKQKVQVDFIPLSTRTYNLNVVMDIEGVGEEISSVSMRAESVVPEVTVSTNELVFGDCFLRYAYKKVIELVNHSNLPAKFELQSQDEISRCVAKYEVDYPKGVIDPFQHRVVTVSFSTERLDKVQLPMFFRVIGHDNHPLEVQCIANGIGPQLTLNPPQLKWGDIQVLKNVEKTLKVKNESLVPACFGALVMKRNSRFKVNVTDVTLGPGETANIKVTANLDDVQNFKDDLCLVVTEGGEIMVPLTAKGTGTTITSTEYELGAEPRVNLGNQFTSRICKKSIVLTNEGPKAQVLSWVNGTAIAAAAAALRQAAKDEEKKKKPTKEVEPVEIFRVEMNGSSEPFTLEPAASCTLEILGMAKKAGLVTEKLCCRSKTDKEQRTIIEMHVNAEFVDPLCEFSNSLLNFEYNHNIDAQSTGVAQFTLPVTLKNICPLPLECSMKCTGAPFSIDCFDVDLKPDESATLQVMFEPGYKSDRVSEVVKQSVLVNYNIGPSVFPKSDRAPAGFHPKRGNVDLTGSINYPNLKFDKMELKFGAILNDTTRRMRVKCTNTSTIKAIFSWSFVVADEGKKRPGSSKSDTAVSLKSDPALAINSVFDILPIRSTLLPGQSEDVEFVFFGHANHKYKALALCEVQGGPEYEIKLEGEASSVQYKFDRISLDYGNILYDKFATEELVLHNTGKVKFDFSVITDSVLPPTVIKAVPQSSSVQPNDKVKIQIQFYPGIPISVSCTFSVEVAHFDPQQIKVTGKGIFPHISVNLPRKDPAKVARLFAEAQTLVGLITQDASGSETARTEGMPLITSRTTQSVEIEAGQPAESPIGRRVKMSMEMFLQSNPYVRQLLAEADCLGMREYIVEQIQRVELEREAQRPKLLLDGDGPDQAKDAAGSNPSSRPESVSSSAPSAGPAAPPGPGGGDAANVGEEAAAATASKGDVMDMQQFVLSEYVCDFGNVIKSNQASKTFKVANVGFAQISFEFSKAVKSMMSGSGFIIEPDRVNRLPGAPDFETVEFGITFNSGRPGVKIGPLELLLPLQVKGGPQVSVLLRANVTVPDVDLSTENIKFGPEPVFCGHCKTVSLLLTNNKEIPASWSFSRAQLVESGAPKSTDAFTVLPDKGLLNPGESCNVQVVFHPRTARSFTVKIPFKVAQNPGKRTLKVLASSENLKIRFEPSLLELRPILPFVEHSDEYVTVHNETDVPVEFFSLDFDRQYLEEESILRKVSIYEAEALGYKDVALLPLRSPGGGLQSNVLAIWNSMCAQEEALRKQAEKANAPADDQVEASDPAAPSPDPVDGAVPDQPAAAEEDGAGAAEGGRLMPVQPLEPDPLLVNVVVHAHPQAGGPRFVRALAKRYLAGVLNINQLVGDCLAEAGIGQYMETVEGEEDEPPKSIPVPGKYVLNQVSELSPQAKSLQEVFFPPLPVPELGADSNAEEDSAEAGKDGLNQQPEARVEEVADGWLTKEILAGLIRKRVSSLDCIRGVVFDGLECQYLPDPPVVLQAIELALVGKALHLVHVGFQPQEIPVDASAPKEDAEAELNADEPVAAEPIEGPVAESNVVDAAEVSDENEEEVQEEDQNKFEEEEKIVEEEDFGPEEVYSEDELATLLEKYENFLPGVIGVFEPPKPEEDEVPSDEAREEPIAVQQSSPKPVVRIVRNAQQPIPELVQAAAPQLPEPGPVPGQARKLQVQDPFVREIVVNPVLRIERRSVRNFSILTPLPEEEKVSDGEPGEGEEDKVAEDAGEEGEIEAKPKFSERSRWTIPAKGSIRLCVRMKAEETGKCEALLGFEIVGGGVVMRGREFFLPVRGMCAFPQISQSYQSIYYRKIKSRSEGQIVSKQYIVSKNIFEFGPLLVGKSKDDYKEKYPENRENFRITNNGLFDLHVDFCFKDDHEGKVFVVEPESLDLPMDETRDITVYAFAEKEGDIVDKLVCNIRNNPEPVEISLSCSGSVPKIVTDIESPTDEEGNPVDGPPKVVFERQILSRKKTQEVKITNDSQLPAKWNLKNISEEDGFNCGKEMSIFPVEGTLQPRQSQIITVGFHALEKAVIEKTVILEWIDVDGLLPEPIKLEFAVLAEAYQIDPIFTFPTGEDVLDFKVLKVVDGGKEDSQQTITITNNGKYEVGYRFAFARPKRSLIAKYFKIETVNEGEHQGKPNGFLEAGESAEVRVIFDSQPFRGEQEISIKDNMDLRCYISEKLTNEDILTTPIKICVRSVFSKYRVLPQKGISFGALTYDTQKTRTFDIVNQGEFEFTFQIKCITSLVRSRPASSFGGSSLPVENEGEPTPDGGIKFGNFTVTPASGSVQPNCEKQTITVHFEATGQAMFSEVLGIQIDDRDPDQDKDGLVYEISGESCIPGIIVEDFLQIFEEAAVLRKPPSDPNQLISNTFIEEERVFHFGPRLVDNRVEVRVKILNPTKVTVTVDLSMSPKGGDLMAFEVLEPQLTIPMHEHRYATVYFTPKGLQTYTAIFEANVVNGSDDKTNKLVFDVRGEGTLPRVTIKDPKLRNEAGQALVNFNRLLVGKSHAVPLLVVNEGILPATIRFSRVGQWPAPSDSKDWSDGPSCFTFSGRGAEIFLASKEERQFDFTFRPKQQSEFRGSLEMLVLKNEFERNVIELKGEGYTRDVGFENLPDGSEDEIRFGQFPVGVPQQMSFSLSNSSNKVFRFSFPSGDPKEFSFVPCVGHLQPRESKAIVATYIASKKSNLESFPLTISLAQIEYTEEVRDWDDSMKEVDWVPDDGAPASPVEESLDSSTILNQSYPLTVSPREGRKGRRKLRKVTKVKPEPKFKPVLVGEPPEEGAEDTRAPAEDSLDLKATLNADYIRYMYLVRGEDGEMEEVAALPGLNFAETMMFRTRVHSFKFKNTCDSKFEFTWRVCHPNGEEDEGPDPPFSVEPQAGTLSPGQVQEVVIKFSPTEVDEYRRRLACFIPHLATRPPRLPVAEGDPPADDGDDAVPEPQVQPEVQIVGRSARPWCHFELIESDWLSGGRRPPTLTTPSGAAVNPKSRCVEFESLGTQVRNTKRFFVMNPTNVSYKFRWECEDGTGAAVSRSASSFKCVHKEGVVLSGKKSEMVFEYTPESDTLIESFWRFEIPELSISIPFILVGHVKEPNVYFDKTFCNFSSLLLNHKATQVIRLINKEHIPFAFAFDGRTYGADEDPPIVQILPTSGTIAPEAELPITVQFMPKLEKNYNFNAVCNVKKKATRLAVNIKGEGFDTHCHVVVEDERGSVQVIPGQMSPVDFGEVHVNETRVKTVSLLNTGKYPIDFEWKTAKVRTLTIKPEIGSVNKGEKLEIKIAFHPLTESHLADHTAIMQIVNGPKYVFSVSASGRKPMLNFSFLSMDFGPCFLYRQGSKPASAVLRVTNEDAHDIGYVVLFDNQPHLELEVSPTNLLPGQSEDIAITFMPREVRSYSDLIPFKINGLFAVNIEITGSGHECDVGLLNPAQFNFPLGAIRAGSVVEKRVKVKNNSPVPALCNIESSAEHLLGSDIRVRPTVFSLRPRETTELELVFAPSQRMEQFVKEIVMEVAGHVRPLIVLNGSAVGIELKLDTDMIFFGAVVANSRTVRRVQLENAGDIGTKWRLTPSAFLPNFSVEPTEGFLNPRDETTLEIAFHPVAVNEDVRRDNLPLYVDGADPLSLTLTGICITSEPERDVIEFKTSVRTPVSSAIPPIANPTDLPWRLRPVLDNEFWTGPEIIEVPPKSQTPYQLTYRPLSMTAADGQDPPPAVPKPLQHEGTVFVPKPDGTAVMHRLVGTAGPPQPEAPLISKEVPCKAWCTENLPIRNWLGRPQRFTVQVDPPLEGTTSLKCASFIDVPPNTERNFAVKFHTFVEGSTRVRVTFRNDETAEYLFFDVEFVAASTPVLSHFDLSTVVRQEKEVEVNLANPLDTPVTMQATCDSADVVVQPTYELRARGETTCRAVYRPLLPSEGETARLQFSSTELGDFVYELRLKAAPAGTERQMQFRAAIGTSSKQTFRFRHLLPSPAVYSCSVDNDVFSVPTQVTAAASPDGKGAEVEVEVTFEPDLLGEAGGKLAVSSDAGGEFVCILSGHGLAPKPQGPIEIRGKGNVDFKNPFPEPKSFTLSVDNDAFATVPRLDGVAARSAVPISVAFRAPAPGVSLPGKLTVACEGYPPWIYYLKGS